MRDRAVDAVLAVLVLFDALLVLWAFAAPAPWFETWHQSLAPSPGAELFLRRCGANWAGFLLFQALALRWWKTRPHWLAVAAGLRLSDIFTDPVYVLTAPDPTWMAWLGLPAAGLLNLALGGYFLAAYHGRVAHLGATT